MGTRGCPHAEFKKIKKNIFTRRIEQQLLSSHSTFWQYMPFEEKEKKRGRKFFEKYLLAKLTRASLEVQQTDSVYKVRKLEKMNCEKTFTPCCSFLHAFDQRCYRKPFHEVGQEFNQFLLRNFSKSHREVTRLRDSSRWVHNPYIS